VRLGRLRCAPRFWLLAALAALISACYPARLGFWPPTERLPELRPGVSSKADVEALLGTPLGRGAARFTPEMAPREVWVYGFLDFDGTSMSIDEGKFIVFFTGDHYDGHLWTLRGEPLKRDTGTQRQ
jgi:hypothetical protein